MFQGRAGKLPYKFIIPVPFLSNPQGFFLGALFEQLSTPHILLSRAPKKERTPGFPKSQRFPTESLAHPYSSNDFCTFHSLFLI
jgi:hypothetical protein